jgi:tetratricopeptide (TPR) repeat protein
LIGWANQALETSSPPYFLHASGLAHYRAGDHEEAIKRLQQSNSMGWTAIAKGQNWLVLALAHAKAGRLDDARRYLQEGRKRTGAAAPPAPEQPTAVYSGDWGALQILLAEAEEVIGGKPAKHGP